jgi:hypothetical protein
MEARMVAVVVVECDAQRLYSNLRGMEMERMRDGQTCFFRSKSPTTLPGNAAGEYYSYSTGEGQ